MDITDVRRDLQAEQQALDDIVAPLRAEQWHLTTPSPRWTIADQIGHLTYFDRTAAQAITDPAEFTQGVERLLGSVGDDDPDAFTLSEFRAMDAEPLLAAWRAGRQSLADAAAGLTDDDRVVWYGPSMGAKSFLTARLMEAWAHGQDIVDALAGAGVEVDREATGRLRHIAQLGYITRGWTYANRGLDVPDVPVARGAHIAHWRAVGVRPQRRQRPAAGVDRGVGVALLPRHHAAPPRRRHRSRGHRRIGARLDGEGPAVRRTTHRRSGCVDVSDTVPPTGADRVISFRPLGDPRSAAHASLAERTRSGRMVGRR